MKSSEAHTRPRADSAKPLAVDDGHHGRRTVGDERNHVAAADRSGDGRDIFVRRGENLLDGIVARRQTADNQRLIQFGAASRAKGEERAAWVARSGDTKGERLGRVALAAAGFQNDFMNHERRAVFVTGTAIVGWIAAQRMNPLGIGTAGSA